MAAKENKHSTTVSRANQKTILWLFLAVMLMFAFGYALVPLYSVFCDITGINGKTDGKVATAANQIDKSRLITVQFIAINNANLPWEFKPNIKTVKLHPGETKRISYFAKNNSSRDMTVQAVPSVTPGNAARYLKKTECFCFSQQHLASDESMDMPVIFHIDNDLPEKIHTITLAYTLFDAKGLRQRPKAKTGKLN